MNFILTLNQLVSILVTKFKFSLYGTVMLRQLLNVVCIPCLSIIHSQDTNLDVVVLLWFIPPEIVVISLPFGRLFRLKIEVKFLDGHTHCTGFNLPSNDKRGRSLLLYVQAASCL